MDARAETVSEKKHAGLRFTRWDAALGAIILLSLLPRIWLAAIAAVDYDGYWHVFIAQQDSWANFFDERHYGNMHPPLYFLLLKAAAALGRNPMVYRAISILSGAVSIWLVWAILRKTARKPLGAAIGALAFGLSLPAVLMSCEVRVYMLCAALTLASFYYFLDLVVPGERPPAKSRALFAVWAILACLTYYGAFFYVAACAGVGLGAALLERKEPVWGRCWRWLATFGPVLATVAALYFWHAGANAGIQNHLTPFYLRPEGTETADEFLRRNLKNLLNVLGPVPVVSRWAYRAALAFLAAGALAYGWLVRRWRERANAMAAAVAAVAVLMLAQVMYMGLTGRYPFGGDLRQQFVLFPFFLLAAAVLFARILDAAAPRKAAAVAAVAAVAIIAVSAVRVVRQPVLRERDFTQPMHRFRRVVPSASAVYVDQFDLVGFFSYHDDWKWRFVGRDASIPGVDVYSVTRGSERMMVFRDKARWNVDYSDPGIYPVLAACMRTRGVTSLALFCWRQAPLAESGAQLRTHVLQYADAAGICAQSIGVNPTNLFAEFKPGGCVSEVRQPGSRTSGLLDDRSPEIDYAGKWESGPFPQASGGTITESNIANTSASLSFYGTSVTYVHTTAWNRGFAEVYVDGWKKAELDLYSKGIGWQTKKEFAGLAPGWHMIEVRVLGKKNPAATDTMVDVDAFIVR